MPDDSSRRPHTITPLRAALLAGGRARADAIRSIRSALARNAGKPKLHVRMMIALGVTSTSTFYGIIHEAELDEELRDATVRPMLAAAIARHGTSPRGVRAIARRMRVSPADLPALAAKYKLATALGGASGSVC